MKTVTYYKAFDGTLFNTSEACKEYEDNSKELTTEKFKKLIVRQAEVLNLTKEGSAFVLAEISEGWWYAVIVMKDENDYNLVKKYAIQCELDPSLIDRIKPIYNTEIMIGIGDGSSSECSYNYCYWYGSVDEMITNYTNTLRTFNLKEDK